MRAVFPRPVQTCKNGLKGLLIFAQKTTLAFMALHIFEVEVCPFLKLVKHKIHSLLITVTHAIIINSLHTL